MALEYQGNNLLARINSNCGAKPNVDRFLSSQPELPDLHEFPCSMLLFIQEQLISQNVQMSNCWYGKEYAYHLQILITAVHNSWACRQL